MHERPPAAHALGRIVPEYQAVDGLKIGRPANFRVLHNPFLSKLYGLPNTILGAWVRRHYIVTDAVAALFASF